MPAISIYFLLVAFLSYSIRCQIACTQGELASAWVWHFSRDSGWHGPWDAGPGKRPWHPCFLLCYGSQAAAG